MRIGILTGGGDVPGLNACIKAVVNRVADEGHQVVGIKRGWGGLANLDPDDDSTFDPNVVDLDPNTVRTVDRTGGTFLHTSRTNPGKVKAAAVPEFLKERFTGEDVQDLTPHVLRVLEHQKIDVLIPIGGDDTLSYGLRMHDEGIPVVAVPTSVGYGANFGGVSALLAMVNSCASNVATVNIDNGFGGGFYAALISRTKGRR